MKTTLILLLLVASCWGQGLTLRSPLRDAGTAATPCPVVDQDFEGTGTPCNWAGAGGTPNFDNTSSPIAGAQDLKLDATADNAAYAPFTASSEVWIRVEFYMTALPGAADVLFYIADAGFGQLPGVQLLANGTLKVFDSGGTSTATMDAMSATTHYWLFLHFKKGSGANAAYDVEFSTTSSRTGSGNKFTSKTDGNMTLDFGNCYSGRTQVQWGTGITFQLDNAAWSSTGWPP